MQRDHAGSESTADRKRIGECLTIRRLHVDNAFAAAVRDDAERRFVRLAIGRDLEALDERPSARFQKHRLPDAAHAAVPTPLFADRLLAVLHRVFHAEDDRAPKLALGRSLERIRQIEFERQITAFMPPEMLTVAPAIGEEVGRANRKDRALTVPLFVRRNNDRAPVPSDFKASRIAVVKAVDFERVSVNALRKVVVVPSGFRFAPRRERFPAKRHRDLFSPRRLGWNKPLLFESDAIGIEAELPGAIQIEPVDAVHEAALTIRPGILRAR